MPSNSKTTLELDQLLACTISKINISYPTGGPFSSCLWNLPNPAYSSFAGGIRMYRSLSEANDVAFRRKLRLDEIDVEKTFFTH